MVFRVFMALLFFLFGVLQYNDPDMLLWMFIYFYVAGISVVSLFKKYRPYHSIIGLVLCGFFAINIDYDFSFQNWFDVEDGREFVGLIMMGFWMVYMIVWFQYLVPTEDQR